MVTLEEGTKIWRLLWCRELFVLELDLLEKMRVKVNNWEVLEEEDGWVLD